MASSSPRPAAAGALLAGICLAMTWASACGLGLDGVGPSADAGDGAPLGPDMSDTGRGDSAGDGDGGLSPSCANLDAACLSAVPRGWLPVTVSDAGCPSSFTSKTLLVNPRVTDGGCACGACQVTGSYTCTGGVAISGGNGCADPPIAHASPGACAPAQAQHIQATPPAATGPVGCFAPNDAGSGATADPFTVCLPTCSADFCAASNRCIIADGNVACPKGFTLLSRAGTGADPGCPACACKADPPGPCGGTVTVFDNATCTDSGASATYPVNTCHQYSTTAVYQSVLVNLVEPDASCSATRSISSAADASLTGIKTICCE